MKRITLLLFLLPLFAGAQEQGIHFVHGLNWQQVKAKAKAENKYIFIDCFATWCGPCKAMSKFVFPQKEAGDFFNKNFINIKLQLDTTANDNEEVKSWHAEGNRMAKEFGVNAFPTFLFFNPAGEAVHRMAGAVQRVDEFISLSAEAMDSTKQYYTLQRKYNSGNRDPQLLKNAAIMLLNTDEKTPAIRIYNEWLQKEPNLYTPDNLAVIAKFTRSTSDTGFSLLLNHLDKISDMPAKQMATRVVISLIAQDEMVAKLMAIHGAVPQWDSLKAVIRSKYPQVSDDDLDEMMAEGKFNYYKFIGDTQNYAPTLIAYMNTYGHKATADQLNNIAWDFFKIYSNENYLTEALAWSKRSLKDNNPLYLDTYANLLYKLGKKEEAFTCEEKAIAFANKVDKDSFKETLGKMKRGEKTWE